MKTNDRKTTYLCQITENSLTVIKCLTVVSKREFISLYNEILPADLDDKKISEHLTHVFKKSGFINQTLIISLPRNRATCRYINIPTDEPNEIEKIAALQAPRYLPYPTNELITGYQIISTNKEGYAKINLVIVPRKIVDRYINIFRRLNIKDPKIILSSYGLCSLHSYICPDSSEPVMIIDTNSRDMEIAISSGGKLLFSRYFTLNSSEPGWENLFISEINKTFDAYFKDTANEKPAKIILVGKTSFLEELANILNKLTLGSAEILSYYKKLGLPDNFFSSVADSNDSYASLIGLGLETLDESLQLAPHDIKKATQIQSKRRELLKLALGVLVICLVSGVAVIKDLNNKSEYLKRIRLETSRIEKEAHSLESIDKKIRLLETRAQNKPQSLEILHGINQALSPGTYLTNFIYEEDKQVTLRGQSSELNAVSNLVLGLQNAAALKNFNIKIKYATRKNTTSGEMLDFEVICLKK